MKHKILAALMAVAVGFTMLAGCTPNNVPPDDGQHTHNYINGVCTQCGDKDPNYAPPSDKGEIADKSKHLIVDKDGNYGGSLNKSLYGEGAPLNGRYDQKDAGYWRTNDFYSLKSSQTRTLFSGFMPYQQTMADSSGLACALMILNDQGEDVYNEHTELNLVNMYEAINKTTVYKNGTTPEGLKNLFVNLGYSAKANCFTDTSGTTNQKIAACGAWIESLVREGKYVLVRYQDTMDFGWHLIIGYDNMGSDYGRDHVLIMADPFDNSDHCQDGYYVSGVGRFYRWWMNVQPSGEYSDQYDCVVVTPKKERTFQRGEDDLQPVQEIPELHLLLNPDGSYGGTLNAELYGEVNEKNGQTDHKNSIYYTFPDYYNMTNEGSRLICTNFRAFQQTMASSCGICSTMAVLAYYGEDISKYDEVWLSDKYCELTGKSTIRGVGCGQSGLKKVVEQLGYTSEGFSYARDKFKGPDSMRFSTYETFLSWVKQNLAKGTPMPVSWRPHSGHWEVIIGVDDMGTDYLYDDVLILADSHDTWDHYQDGYNTYAATMFYRQWYNGSFTYNQQFNVFDKKSV